MKLKNSTDFDAKFLRRMISWCCRQIVMPVKACRQAEFTNCTRCYRGRAFSCGRRILVRTSPTASDFPCNASYGHRGYSHGEKFADRIEALVSVTAHELLHIASYCVPGHRGKATEAYTVAQEMKILRAFREQRETLLPAWGAVAAKAEPKATMTTAEKNQAARLARLAEWESKLKRAQSKVRKYRQAVRAAERRFAIAAKKGDKS